MIWQNPWAWAGLATIALPILIHRLGQQRARRIPFPSLRFVGESRPLPTRRTKLQDLLLLAVRVSIFAAAVAALGQPRFNTQARLAATSHALVRAVIIDQGASMARRSVAGQPAIVVAQQVAAAIADSAERHVLLIATRPADAIPGAVAWLQRQSGRAELVVVSDFQRGSVERADLRAVPTRVGVRLVRIPIADTTGSIVVRSRLGSSDLLATATLLPDATGIEWRSGAPAAASSLRVQALTGPEDINGASAAAQAAQSVATKLPLDTLHRVALVYSHAAERASVLRNARGVHSNWMAELLTTLRADSLLASAAATASRVDSVSSPAAFVVVRALDGRPVVLATEATLRGVDQLVLLPLSDAGSLATTALIVATNRALSLATPSGELDPATVADSALAQWQRPVGAAAGSDSDASDGRWFWLAVLLLLGLEWLLRRRMTPPAAIRLA
jgi:hypothetical protein